MTMTAGLRVSTGFGSAATARQLIGGIDQRLSRAHGIRPFTTDPRCLLRIAVIPAPRALTLSDGATVAPGDPVADIHCWNDRVPPMPATGPDLAWAQDISKRFRTSLRLLAAEMIRDPALAGVAACRARVNLVGHGCSNASVSRIIARMGFEDVDEGQGGALARLHDRLENLLTAALVWTYNPQALRRDKMMRERRPVWASRTRVLQLHGDPSILAPRVRGRADRAPGGSGTFAIAE